MAVWEEVATTILHGVHAQLSLLLISAAMMMGPPGLRLFVGGLRELLAVGVGDDAD